MKYELELLVHRPRSEVWKFFLDRETIKFWQPTLTRIEQVKGTAGQPGSESRWMYEENDREFSLTEKVLAYEAPSRFESLFENKFASNTVNNQFEEQAGDQTLWVMETRYRFKTLLMKILGPLLKKNYVARSKKEMEQFKEILEKE